ncbi:ParB/RepB/Spo0J family partition protein [Tabrizicola fusiformis]|uniref:ParB/RepB/Spo0J family partition protein n=1 Tax=Tabrizicola sp. SY72 TaxID=2741673 RepID=UPI0015733A7B|nr:ParB N-terminal domain-containing protein [Tabrizicola sp. SY72]NTT88523.1 ParB N-terminal domain-containing protein [Tabrizicola sp. SY72]
MTPTLMQIDKVPVAEVIVRDRLRPVSDAGVESLIASITEIGVMKDAIHVRKKKDGQLYLMAGGHRLEAARRLNWVHVPAKVWTDVTDDWARMVEIDDNLAGAEMNALDSAVFLATRKEVYERLHPETKRGVAGGLARQGSASELSSFAAATAAKFGMTARQVQKIVAAGTALSPRDVAHLRQAPRPVSLKDLTEIAKIGDPVERGDVVLRLSVGNAKSAADARRSLRVEGGLQAPAKSPEDQALLALTSAWARAGKAVLRRFIDQEFGEIAPLVADEAERRGEFGLATAIRGGLDAK